MYCTSVQRNLSANSSSDATPEITGLGDLQIISKPCESSSTSLQLNIDCDVIPLGSSRIQCACPVWPISNQVLAYAICSGYFVCSEFCCMRFLDIGVSKFQVVAPHSSDSLLSGHVNLHLIHDMEPEWFQTFANQRSWLWRRGPNVGGWLQINF